MANYSYEGGYKYSMGMTFITTEAAKNFAYEYDVDISDRGRDKVDLWFKNKTDLNKFVKIAINDKNITYFYVQK